MGICGNSCLNLNQYQLQTPLDFHGKFFLVGGFSPTPLKNMLVKMGSSSPSRDEHKKYVSCHHPVFLCFTNLLGSKLTSLKKLALTDSLLPTRPANMWSLAFPGNTRCLKCLGEVCNVRCETSQKRPKTGCNVRLVMWYGWFSFLAFIFAQYGKA